MYKLTENPQWIKRLSDGVFIGVEEGSPSYIAYQQWLAEGNTPEPALTAQEEADVVLQEEIEALKTQLIKMNVFVFKLVDALFRVGVNKTLWTPADFPESLRDTVIIVREKLDRLTQLGE